MNQRLAVVSGSTSGIGKANVELLLKKGIDVIGLARSIDKAEQLEKEMDSLSLLGKLTVVMGDLSSIDSTQKAITDIQKVIVEDYQGKLDILMNVAGIVSSGLHLNEDGNEVTFHTNHLSVFLMTLAMTPFLEESKNPRIIVVSSLSHYRANICFNNLQSKKFYNILKAYKRSKLYNVLFVKEFSRRYPKLPIYAIDPGLVKTEIGLKNTSKLEKIVWSWRVSKGTDAYYPAQFMVNIVTENSYLKESGQYLKEGIVKKSNPITYRKDYALKLWEYSEGLIHKQK